MPGSWRSLITPNYDQALFFKHRTYIYFIPLKRLTEYILYYTYVVGSFDIRTYSCVYIFIPLACPRSLKLQYVMFIYFLHFEP